MGRIDHDTFSQPATHFAGPSEVMSARSTWRHYSSLSDHRLASQLLPIYYPAAFTICRASIPATSRCAHNKPSRQRKPVPGNDRQRYKELESKMPDMLNPPRTTRPPKLTTPNREAYESYPKYLFELGKAYVNFYKEGVKSVWANRNLLKEKYSRTPQDDRPTIWNPSYVPKSFSRADWVLMWRTRHDMIRLPVFGLMLIVIGEMTVLIVAACEGLVPYPCRIPSQIFHSQQRAERRRRLAFDQLEAKYSEGPLDANLSKLSARNHVLRSLHMSGDPWEWIGGYVPPGLWQIKGRLRMAFLEGDDKNMVHDGGPMGLSNEEVRLACVDRGINILDRSETELRGCLGDWLRLVASENDLERRRRMTVLLLTRPEHWPQKRDFALPNWTL